MGFKFQLKCGYVNDSIVRMAQNKILLHGRFEFLYNIDGLAVIESAIEEHTLYLHIGSTLDDFYDQVGDISLDVISGDRAAFGLGSAVLVDKFGEKKDLDQYRQELYEAYQSKFRPTDEEVAIDMFGQAIGESVARVVKRLVKAGYI